MKKNILNSPRLLELKKRRRRIIFNRGFLVGFFLVIIFIGLSFLSHLDSLNISQIEIVGNKIIDTEMIEEIVNKELIGNYVWIFPKTNIFLYPKNKIKKELSSNVTRLENIILSIGERKILKVSLGERVPEYTWCGVIISTPKDENEPCYFLDEKGYIFDEAPYFSGDVYFKFYGSIDQNDGTPAGSYFMESNFKNLILFKETLENMDLNPVSLYIEENGNVRISLSSKSLLPTGPEIIFKINSDFQKLTENLQTAFATEPLLTDFKKKYSTLLYIDLRFGNKVYYKFR